MISLLKNIDDFDFILASKSPRRYELLKMVGLNFTVRPSHVKELNKDDLSPIEYAINNAKKKGAFISEMLPDSLVMSADTIVVHDNDILEKPKDREHAHEILKRLSGVTHEVVTGFGLFLQAKNRFEYSHEVTHVTFRSLSQDEIIAYVNTGEPFDKAGGYGAQGSGALLIKKIDGCFYNVVGLPLSNFFTTLEKFLTTL